MMDELTRMQIEDGDTFVYQNGAAFKLPLTTQNPSGISPTEFKVLILPKPVEEKKGSILLPEMTKEQDKWATTEGTIIAVSPLAFTYASSTEWAAVNAVPPKPGDRIIYAKYAGKYVKGRDGADYVLANDKDVMAVLTD